MASSSSSTRKVLTVDNTELYNRWAKVYDTDGNILQAIDDLLIPTLLNIAFTHLSASTPNPITITELGAGTGRNTSKLLLPSIPPLDIKEINALDLSPQMLAIAQRRCTSILSNTASTSPSPRLNFHEFNALNPELFPEVQNTLSKRANLVLSTLVLEHLPIRIFFSTIKSLLINPTTSSTPLLILTNMHPAMGHISQAGFLDPATGEKIRGESFTHEIEDVVDIAQEYGFEVLGEVRERGVEEGDLDILGERGRKWVGVRVWFGCVLKLVSSE